MSQDKLDKVKNAIKENFHVNKDGEVELNKDAQDAIAGGVTPEGGEEESNLVCPNSGCIIVVPK